MNSLLNALEALYDSIAAIETHDHATRIRGSLVVLLHKDEFSIPQSDPNHPYGRFAKHGDTEGNRNRLWHATQELLDDDDTRACLDMMFDTPDTDPYNAVTRVMRKYMTYVDALRNTDSDGDSDSS
jgi:hypothetical protein